MVGIVETAQWREFILSCADVKMDDLFSCMCWFLYNRLIFSRCSFVPSIPLHFHEDLLFNVSVLTPN